MKKYIALLTLIIMSFGLTFFVAPEHSYAQDPDNLSENTFTVQQQPQTLTNPPNLLSSGIADFITAGSETNLVGFLQGAYRFGVSLASVLAIIMIFYAGFRYVTSINADGKGDAKRRIQASIGGLLLALSSFLILRSINPDLVTIRFGLGEVDGLGIAIAEPCEIELTQQHTFLSYITAEKAYAQTDPPCVRVFDIPDPLPQAATTTSTYTGPSAGQPAGSHSVSSNSVTFPNGATFNIVSVSEAGSNWRDLSDNSGNVPIISVKNRRSEKISKYYSISDFNKNGRNGDYVRIDPQLVHFLDIASDRMGRKVPINSGYRNVPYNQGVGGATKSRHMAGDAADTGAGWSSSDRGKLAALYLEIMGCNIGVGLYSSFVHVDLRGRQSRWNSGTQSTVRNAFNSKASSLGCRGGM